MIDTETIPIITGVIVIIVVSYLAYKENKSSLDSNDKRIIKEIVNSWHDEVIYNKFIQLLEEIKYEDKFSTRQEENLKARIREVMEESE